MVTGWTLDVDRPRHLTVLDALDSEIDAIPHGAALPLSLPLTDERRRIEALLLREGGRDNLLGLVLRQDRLVVGHRLLGEGRIHVERKRGDGACERERDHKRKGGDAKNDYDSGLHGCLLKYGASLQPTPYNAGAPKRN